MTAPILVTGATGTVGGAVLPLLLERGLPVRATSRSARFGSRFDERVEAVSFDFTEPRTWAAAFAGVERMLVVRPPALGDARRDVLPALEAAKAAGVRHMVLLSIQGADRVRVVPHAAIERWLAASGLSWTFARASFFHQNLTAALLPDIRDWNEISVPAGRGATAWVDARDVAAVCAEALADPDAHRNVAYTLTGDEALTYRQVASLLTAELGRPIHYTHPGLLEYLRRARSTGGMPTGMAVVTAAIYTTARLGLAASLSGDLRRLLGRDPVPLAAFVHENRDAWAHA